MVVAICQINSKYVHSSLAAWYLSASLEEAGYECLVHEGSINESEDKLFSSLVELNADIYCFSSYIWNITLVLSLSKRLKEYDEGVTIVLGGPEVAYRAESVLKDYPYIDYVISGEGEVPIVSLVSSCQKGISPFENKAISGRMGSEIIVGEPCVELTDPPCPYSSKYLDALKGRIAYIETSRGCPFKCAYCLSGVQKMRFFDINRAKKDILTLARASCKTVKFIDRTFNADEERAYEIFSFILEERERGVIPPFVTFHFEIAGELITERTLALLKKVPVGLFQFEIGVQSFNKNTLRAINRRTNTERLALVIKELSSQNNIHIHADLIAGLPYEDIDSFRCTYNELYRLGSHKLQLGFLKLLYGSSMRETPELYPCEYEKLPPYTVKSTPWLSAEDFEVIKSAERANDAIFYSARFNRTVEYLLKASRLDPFSLAVFLGERVCSETSASLFSLFERIYGACSALEGVDGGILRDMLLFDRIAYDNSCVIPKSLRVEDARLPRIARFLREKYNVCNGVRMSVGILYSEGSVVFAKYDEKHPVSRRYRVYEIPYAEIEREMSDEGN